MRAWILLVAVGIITGCTGLPKNVVPVDDFDGERYLGTWYEIARLDHRFERGLRNVTATYSPRNKGGPFYATYALFELDKDDYQYAFVSGHSTKYLWLLSRTPEVSESLIDKFKAQSKALGFDTSDLIMVNHDPKGAD